jgi:hypothetical protein
MDDRPDGNSPKAQDRKWRSPSGERGSIAKSMSREITRRKLPSIAMTSWLNAIAAMAAAV